VKVTEYGKPANPAGGNSGEIESVAAALSAGSCPTIRLAESRSKSERDRGVGKLG
jgi:hypothetical protein